MFKKISSLYLSFTLALCMAIMAVVPAEVFAASGSTISSPDRGSSLDGTIDWPWTRFLNSLADELTGPLPMVLGLLGISIAAMALLFGNGGAGTQKALLLIGAVSVDMFTPTLVKYIYASASGATVDMVIGLGSSFTPPPLP